MEVTRNIRSALPTRVELRASGNTGTSLFRKSIEKAAQWRDSGCADVVAE